MVMAAPAWLSARPAPWKGAALSALLLLAISGVGTTYVGDIGACDAIDNVKAKVQNEKGIPRGQLRLIFVGMQLRNGGVVPALTLLTPLCSHLLPAAERR